jgi:carbon starvation protein
MNILLMFIISLAASVLAYAVYARYIGKVFHVSDQRATPAARMADGVDYVPTPFPVLFSHHFATIAGAGPIVGPTIAAVYGIYPSWLWVLFGAVFFGAVHDYTSMLVSLRERGRSIAEVAGNLTGRLGFLLYIAFTLLMIVILTAAFLDLSVQALTSVTSAALVQLPAANPFHWQMALGPDGSQMVRIGGIATASVIVMTLFAPLIGWMTYKLRWKTSIVGAVALCAAALSVWAGLYHPVSFGGMNDATIRIIWMLILAAYVLLASAVPVWLILQGRDFINVYTLVGGMLLLMAGCIAGGLQGINTDTQFSWQIHQGTVSLGLFWPVMFITIACGAISGFHALVTGGTSGKQCMRESDAKRVAFGGMLTESLLSVLVLVAIGAGLGMQQYMAVQFPVGKAGNPVLSFSLGMGLLSNKALGLPVYMGTIFGLLMVEGFIITTLDTAVRLNRYLLEELWHFLWHGAPPALMRNYYFNSGICVLAMLALALPNGWKAIWPVFGTANQLLASLTLAAVSIWLSCRARPAWFTLGPAAFMMTTCLGSLGLIISKEWGKLGAAAGPNWAVLAVAMLLFCLSLGVIYLTCAKLWEIYSGKQPVIRDDDPEPLAATRAAR